MQSSMAQNQNKLLLSSRELAPILGCSWRHIENLRRKRLIPCIRLGHLVKFRLSDVEKALENLTVEAVR
jgi:excisionase family DNA binding protein